MPYSDVNARMNITLSTVSDNTGVLNGVGGAAFLSGDTVLSVSASNITHNIAKFGGAYYSRDDGIVRARVGGVAAVDSRARQPYGRVA